MNLAQLVQVRRTVHNYKPDKVPDGLVEKALELSLWAPNHKLTFPWAYFWVGTVVRSQLADLAVQLKEAKGPMSEIQRKAARENLTQPSHLIVLGVRKSEPKRMHEDYATLACSVQIATLFLTENGVGSKWSTGGYSNHPETYKILGVSPEEVQLEGALMIGIPSLIPAVPARPSLGQFLTKTD